MKQIFSYKNEKCPNCEHKLSKFLNSSLCEGGKKFECPKCSAKLKFKVVTRRDYNLPLYVKVGGTCLRRVYTRFGEVYHKDAGNWDVKYFCEYKGKRRNILVNKNSDKQLKHLYGKPLEKCSKEEWEQDNEGYLPTDKWGLQLQKYHAGHYLPSIDKINMAIEGVIGSYSEFEPLDDKEALKSIGVISMTGHRSYSQSTGPDGEWIPDRCKDLWEEYLEKKNYETNRTIEKSRKRNC